MNNVINSLLIEFQTNGQTLSGSMETVEDHFGCVFPEDYKTFLQLNNGGEGFVGEQYLILWRVEEIIGLNREYEVAEYAPGLILFGSNGGGEAFAFDIRDKQIKIVVVPFIGMCIENVLFVAFDFNDFITQIAKPDGLFP